MWSLWSRIRAGSIIGTQTQPNTVLLEADHVSVKFGDLVAVNDVSFTVSKGELIGMVGPNGAGKTTLLRVLCGLHAPTRGEARVLGYPVLGEDQVVRHQVGFAPDAPPAYEQITIEQFLQFIGAAYCLEPEDTEERIDFWLDQLWLKPKRRTKIGELSRGMRQRVTLARTFMVKPHVVLLDEPLSGLDPAGRRHLRNIIAMLRDQGCAMIVSSHILSDLEEIATHVGIIEHGRIVRWSTTEALHHDGSEARRYRLTLHLGKPQHFEWLQAVPGLSNLEHDRSAYLFSFHGGNEHAAALLRDMVQAGLPVLSFDRIKASLEETYLRSGLQQVD